ncbi:MAG: RluA family pseudouridine synthase [Firmicutes bacterium]|nr:RluA family pseudouridine synthase [Bacillota bacterium]
MLLYTVTVAPASDGKMVKELLASVRLSRTLRRSLLEQGLIQVNARPCFWTSRVHVGDEVTVMAPVEAPGAVAPEDLPLDVVFEDEHLLIVDKAAGMVVHPTGSYAQGTLVAAVNFYLKGRGPTGHCRPLHRLDKDTSGLVIFAKHKLAHERLTRQLLARQIHREYVAFVGGWVPFERRTIDAPICRPANDRLQRAVAPYGKDAVTDVRLVARCKSWPASVVALRLHTGRTHQIRVHLAHIGHPVLCDWLYGPGESVQGPECGELRRQALHAGRLVLRHPQSGAVLTLDAPLPADMSAWLSETCGWLGGESTSHLCLYSPGGDEIV